MQNCRNLYYVRKLKCAISKTLLLSLMRQSIWNYTVRPEMRFIREVSQLMACQENQQI